MSEKNKASHGIVLNNGGQEQPKEQDRSQTQHGTEKGKMPSQPMKEDRPDNNNDQAC
jgi:hypothetical protein